jgi:hypothetical protein
MCSITGHPFFTQSCERATQLGFHNCRSGSTPLPSLSRPPTWLRKSSECSLPARCSSSGMQRPVLRCASHSMSSFLATARRNCRSSCQRQRGALTAVSTPRALHVSARACCAPAGSGSGDRTEPAMFVDPRPRILAAALNHVNREG